MYVVATDSGSPITSYTFDEATQISTFNTTAENGFGLQRGNAFVTFDAEGDPLGKYYVSASPVPTTITAVTGIELGGISVVGKCGYDDNDANTGPGGENVGVRGTAPFDLGIFFLIGNSGTGNVITVAANDGGVSGKVAQKLPLGRYLQLGSEIIRVSSTSFEWIESKYRHCYSWCLGTRYYQSPISSKDSCYQSH